VEIKCDYRKCPVVFYRTSMLLSNPKASEEYCSDRSFRVFRVSVVSSYRSSAKEPMPGGRSGDQDGDRSRKHGIHGRYTEKTHRCMAMMMNVYERLSCCEFGVEIKCDYRKCPVVFYRTSMLPSYPKASEEYCSDRSFRVFRVFRVSVVSSYRSSVKEPMPGGRSGDQDGDRSGSGGGFPMDGPPGIEGRCLTGTTTANHGTTEYTKGTRRRRPTDAWQ
jgi:hypothetical protein